MQKTLSYLLLVVIAVTALASGSPPNPQGEDYVEFVYKDVGTDESGELGLSSWECQTCLEDCDTDTQISTKSECRQV